MTAEVALLNRHAVALAADSALTLGSAGQPMKIYNSANKLHMLAEDQPVGIMVYNNAELSGVSWETLVKLFRKKLGSRTFSTIDGYLDEFISYLTSDALHYIPQDVRKAYLLSSVEALLFVIRRSIENDLTRASSERELTSAGRQRIAGRVVGQYMESVLDFPLLDAGDESEMRHAVSGYASELGVLANRTFSGLPISETAQSKIERIAREVLVRAVPTPDYSGVVIAGFGDDRVFPQLRSFNAFGYVDNHLRRTVAERVDIAHHEPAFVGAFAQSEMVGTFMEGLDPQYREFLEVFMNESFRGLSDVVLKRVSGLTKSDQAARFELDAIFRELERELSDQMSSYRQENHVEPVISSVALMPKEELTSLAEALVSLTSVKRRATLGHETVGGPIDVALITKGDGFVWIERKHYFRPELNPRFVARHYLPSEKGTDREGH